MRLTQWIAGLILIAVGAAGALWMVSSREASQLREENQELKRENFELTQAIDRLNGENRVAEIYVHDQVRAGQLVNGRPAEETMTTIEFIELDRDGHPLPSQQFVIYDDVIFFDAWVLHFDHEHVAAGDALRGKSLALFRRIFGEHQEPADGYPIDRRGDVPDVYRLDSSQPTPGQFEARLWSRFWDYARDPDLAASEGVRVAQGEAVYVPMERGQVWTLSLANNGGLSIKIRRPHADLTTRALMNAGTTRPAASAR